MDITLGTVYRDIVTGFIGVAVCRCTELSGDVRIGLEARILRDDKPIERQYFDESRLRVISFEGGSVSIFDPKA